MKKSDMYIGQPVVNTVAGKNFYGTVIGFCEANGDPIIQEYANSTVRWQANADLCEPLRDEEFCYKDGLVIFG